MSWRIALIDGLIRAAAAAAAADDDVAVDACHGHHYTPGRQHIAVQYRLTAGQLAAPSCQGWGALQ